MVTSWTNHLTKTIAVARKVLQEGGNTYFYHSSIFNNSLKKVKVAVWGNLSFNIETSLLKIKFKTSPNAPFCYIRMVEVTQSLNHINPKDFKNIGDTNTYLHIRFTV